MLWLVRKGGAAGDGQAVAQNGRLYGVVANVVVIPDKGFQAMVMSWSSVPAGGESIVGLAAGGYDRARRGHCRPPTHESEGGDRGAGRPSASAGQGLERVLKGVQEPGHGSGLVEVEEVAEPGVGGVPED